MEVERGGARPAGAGVPLGVWGDPAKPSTGVALAHGEGHRLILGPTGSGKFWAAIAPMLLSCDKASIVVFDVATGEAHKHTAAHRKSLGRVLTLDPYGATESVGEGLNPLDPLTDCPDPDDLFGLALDLADAVLMQPPRSGGNSDYWNDLARELLVALLLHVATSPYETDRTLGRVRDLILTEFMAGTAAAPEPAGFLSDMCLSEVAGGFVRATALSIVAAFEHDSAKTALSIQTTLKTQTLFLQDERVRRCLAKTTVPVRDLRKGVATLYVVAPAKRLRNLGRWLRLIYTTLMAQVLERSDADAFSAGRYVPLHFILDEFPQFGPFWRVSDDLATVRKFGVHLHLAVQKVSQLERHYSRDWQIFVPDCLQVMGCDENSAAKYISELMGTEIRLRASSGEQRSASGPSVSTSEAETREPIMQPHEVRELDRNKLIMIIPGGSARLRKWWGYSDPYLLSRATNVVRR